jgi:hypothetical protein
VIAAESALSKLPTATSGKIRTIHAADPAGANACLSAAESRTAADAHATAADMPTRHMPTSHAATPHVHPAAAHAASSVRVLRQGRGCSC